MADLQIRAAVSGDHTALEPLIVDALSRLGSLRGGPALLQAIEVDPAPEPAMLAAQLADGSLPSVTTLVAVLDGSVVGMAVAVATRDGVDLVGVHTARSLRRRRIGSELLAAARALADDDVRFEALALPGDQTVKSLLEAAGFRARLLRMSDDR